LLLKTDPDVLIGSDGGDAWMRSVHGGSSTVVFGPGGARAHGADELVSIDDIVAVQKASVSTILEWCGYEST